MTHLRCPSCGEETSLTDDLDHDRITVARACAARHDDEHRHFFARHVETLAPPFTLEADALGDLLAYAASATDATLFAINEVRASSRLPNVLALLTSHRDHARDHGTHGIGATTGLPWEHSQRVADRETERALDLLIGVLS